MAAAAWLSGFPRALVGLGALMFVVSDLLGGAKSMLAGNLIQNQFAVARNRPFGSAIAFELMAVVLVLLMAYAWYTKRKGQEAML